MSKPGKVLKGLCKKLGVRLTVKRGKKRVYKSIKTLKAQCKRKAKKKKRKKVKRKRKFGQAPLPDDFEARYRNLPMDLQRLIARFMGPNLAPHRLQRNDPERPIEFEDRNDFNENPIRRRFGEKTSIRKIKPQKLKKAQEKVKKVTKDMKPLEAVFITLMLIFPPLMALALWERLRKLSMQCNINCLVYDNLIEKLQDEYETLLILHGNTEKVKKLKEVLDELKKIYNLECCHPDRDAFTFGKIKKTTGGNKKIEKMVKDFKKEGYNGFEIAGIVLSILFGIPYYTLLYWILFDNVKKQMICTENILCKKKMSALVDKFDKIKLSLNAAAAKMQYNYGRRTNNVSKTR